MPENSPIILQQASKGEAKEFISIEVECTETAENTKNPPSPQKDTKA